MLIAPNCDPDAFLSRLRIDNDGSVGIRQMDRHMLTIAINGISGPRGKH